MEKSVGRKSRSAVLVLVQELFWAVDFIRVEQLFSMFFFCIPSFYT